MNYSELFSWINKLIPSPYSSSIPSSYISSSECYYPFELKMSNFYDPTEGPYITRSTTVYYAGF